jgi:hypothetical protein
VSFFIEQLRVVTCCKRCKHWTDQQEEVLITITISAEDPTPRVFAICRDTTMCDQRIQAAKQAKQ